MWEINSGSQAFTAVLALGLGVCICVLYDIVRAARDYKRPSFVAVFVADVLFFAVCAVVVFSFLQLFANGQPRLYILACMGAGFLFCRLTVSFYIAKYVKVIMRKIAKLTVVIKRTFEIFIAFFEKIFNDLEKFLKKALKGLKIKQKTLEKQ